MRDLLPVVRGRLVAIAALLLANAAVFLAVVRPVAVRVLDRDGVVARLEARLAAAGVEEKRRLAARASLAQAEAYAAGFPPRAEMLALADWLRRLAEALDVTVPTVAYRPDSRAAGGAPLTRVTVAMTVEGPYRDLRRLVYELERERGRVVIENASLRGRPKEGTVQLALELSAYFR